jgi:catechol 2,3-dioxygenase-like lactoylglutathione lyase family enzyme
MDGTQLRYAIKFVADMDKAVKFYRDVVGLKVKFESPGWSEFACEISKWYLERDVVDGGKCCIQAAITVTP